MMGILKYIRVSSERLYYTVLAVLLCVIIFEIVMLYKQHQRFNKLYRDCIQLIQQ